MNKEPTSWITVKGNHIPIFEGQTQEEAINNFFNDKYEEDLEDTKPLVTAKRYYIGDMEVWASAVKGIKKSGRESELRIVEESIPEDSAYIRSYPKLKKQEDYKQAAVATNPHYDTGKYEWTYNCQRCVVAWEMRYRGYDVTAKPRLSAEDDIVFKDANDWRKCFKGFEWESLDYYYPEDPTQTYRDIELEVLKNPCGSRFIFSIQWMKHRWQDKASRHAFIGVINDKHELEYYDPQSGKKYHWKSYANMRHTKWCRIDNKELTDLVSNCVYKEGEDKNETTQEQE